MIKNTTPYIGKIKFKFEKYPEYTGKSKLNKIHLNLGFTKLVSRITPHKDLNGWLINPECIYLIQKHTGGKIGSHSFGDKNEHTLPNSFLTKDGGYIGDIERGWWYYENKGNLIGYHGYTHRGGQTFKIGDRLFYASYTPNEDDYEEWEWSGWQLKFEELYSKGDDLDKKWMDKEGIGYVIPFNKRGGKVIDNFKECLQAAINMSKDLS
jgi:hypothetical protein